MKRISFFLYVLIILSVINILIFIFHLQQKSSAKNYIVPISSEMGQQLVPSDVWMPETFDFAGENVPLHRIDIQEAFKKELIVNSNFHSNTIQLLKNAPRIFKIIEPILKEAGIPDDFKYLAVIESNLNPLAVSPVGAAGIWQFMEATAKEYKLEVNREIDERYHIEKATRAAAAYLKEAFQKFGSWTLAAASYNAGTRMVSNQIEIQKEKSYYDLLLGEETGRYVFRILALKQIMLHPEQYYFQVQIVYPEEKTKKITVESSVSDWAEFAKQQGITYKTLKRFNPWLRKNDLINIANKTYEIAIPVEKELYK